MHAWRLAACASVLGVASAASLADVRITTTPSHTATNTPTPTPTATLTPTVTSTPTGAVTHRPTPWAVHGPEQLVPATTNGDQQEPAVSIGSTGRMVAAWRSEGQDGDAGGIFGRQFDDAGLPLGSGFQVNTVTTGHQSQPGLASDSSGNFVVVWTSPDAAGGTDVFARRYDSGGTPLTGQFQVNTYTTGYQDSPRIAMSDDGFVVVWASSPLPGQTGQDGDQSGIFGQRYSVNGVPDDGEFPVNTYSTGAQRFPSVGRSRFNDFTVVWESQGQDGDLGGIFGQRYLDSGVPFGDEFAVNDLTAGDQSQPDISGSNQFVVVWSSEGNDGSGKDVYGHAFSWILPVTSDFRINRDTAGDQSRPRAGYDAFSYPSGFVVAWESSGQYDPTDPGSTGIYARRFDNSPYPTAVSFLVQPRPRGAEYQVNAYTGGNQSSPAVSRASDGRFVVAWQSSGQDGSGEGVFATRFQFPAASRMKVDETPASGSSNLDGLLEPGETVTVDPFWTNFSESPLPLFGSASNLTGADGPTRTIDDFNADYGTIPQFGATGDCATATGNCYEVTVSGARPAAHWDDTFDEHPATAGAVGGLPSLTKTWALHVGGSFPDVPQDAFYPYIENLLHNGVTAGGGCGAGLYCGEDPVLRQQMAVFLLKSRLGADYVPPPATGTVFADVAASDPFAPWIEELARRQVTGGCAAPPPPALPLYCPTGVVNRQQMAVFLVKAYWGFDILSGWACSGVFVDVPCTNPFADYIEFIASSGITGGCQVSPPLYCPTDSTKRKQMAAFLVKTFGLQLYGPD